MNVKHLLLLCSIIACTRPKEIPIYKNHGIDGMSLPGLVFEKRSEINFIREVWKIIVCLDVKKIKEELKDIERRFVNIKDNTATFRKDYNQYFTKYIYIESEFNKTHEKLENDEKNINHVQPTMSEFWRRGYAMRTEALERFPDKIMSSRDTKLFILESSLNKGLIFSGKTGFYLGQLVNKLDQQSRWAVGSYSNDEYGKLFDNITRLIDDKLQESKKRSGEILEAVQAIQKGQITPTLFDRETFEKLSETIRNTTNYKLPTRFEIGEMDYLSEISEIKYGVWEDKFFIELQIPLVGTEKVIGYKMHSVMTRQPALGKTETFAFIKPRGEWLLVKGKEHYNLEQSELTQCKLIKNSYLCPAEWFLFNTIDNCESTLFFTPAREPFQKCNIQLTNNFQEKFIRSHDQNSWLYVLENPVNLEQKCKGQPKILRRLEGGGIIQFPAYCHLTYKNKNFTLKSPTITNETNFIVPPVVLNLQNIAEILRTTAGRAVFNEFLTMGDTYDFGYINSLTKIFVKQEQTNQSLTVILSIAVIFISVLLFIIGGILAFLYYFREVLRNTPDEIELKICEKVDDEINIENAGGTIKQRLLKFH